MRDAIKSMSSRITWDAIIVNMLMLAGMGAVIYYAQKRSIDPVTTALVAAVGIAGVYYVRKGSHIACDAWFQRRLIKFAGAISLLAVAFAIEGNNHLSVGSSNQDGLTADRIAAKGRSDSAMAELQSAAKRLTKLEDEAAWKANVPPLEAIQKAIDGEKATKFFRETTQGCTITKGPQTTEFCRKLAQLEADKAMASRKPVLAEEIKQARKEHEAARKASEDAGVVTSIERADTRNIKKAAAWVGFNDFDVEFSNAVLFFLGLCLMLSITEWINTAAKYEGEQLRPWPFMVWLRNIWTGRKEDEQTTLGTGDPSVRPSANASPAPLSVSPMLGTQTAPQFHTTVIKDGTLAEWARHPDVARLLGSRHIAIGAR